MRKTWLIFNVLASTTMTTGTVSALEESVKNSPPGMVEQHDQNGDGQVAISEFPEPDKHFNWFDQNEAR